MEMYSRKRCWLLKDDSDRVDAHNIWKLCQRTMVATRSVDIREKP